MTITNLFVLLSIVWVFLQTEGRMRRSLSACHCMACVRRPSTLKGTATDVAFRYVLNVEAFTMAAASPLKNSSMWLPAAECRKSDCFPTHSIVICLPTTAWAMRRQGWGIIQNVYMLFLLLQTAVTVYIYLCAIELISSPSSYMEWHYIVARSVRLTYFMVELDL